MLSHPTGLLNPNEPTRENLDLLLLKTFFSSLPCLSVLFSFADALKQIIDEATQQGIELRAVAEGRELWSLLSKERKVIVLLEAALKEEDEVQKGYRLGEALDQTGELQVLLDDCSSKHFEVGDRYKSLLSSATGERERILRRARAREQLARAWANEDPEELEPALAEAKACGLGEAETAEASALLERVRHERELLEAVKRAAGGTDIEDLEQVSPPPSSHSLPLLLLSLSTCSSWHTSSTNHPGAYLA